MPPPPPPLVFFLNSIKSDIFCFSISNQRCEYTAAALCQADAERLKEASLNFIKKHAAQVMQTEGWSMARRHQGGALAVEVRLTFQLWG